MFKMFDLVVAQSEDNPMVGYEGRVVAITGALEKGRMIDYLHIRTVAEGAILKVRATSIVKCNGQWLPANVKVKANG